MELRHLIYFEAVVRHQNITRAAEELAVAQPAITKQMHDLEKELGGGPFYERVGRQLRLTETGKCLINHTRSILAQVEVLREEVREHGELKRGRISLGAPPSVGEKLLPEILADFHRLHPTLELCLYEAASQNLLTLLESGEIDLAILTLPNDPRGLRLTTLFREELVVVVGLDHPLAARHEVHFTELADEPFLLDYPGRVRETTLEACRKAGFTPRIVLNGGSVEMLLRLTRTGLGITMLPELAVRGRRGLAMLSIKDQVLEREMVLALSEGRILTPAVLAMRDYLENNLTRS